MEVDSLFIQLQRDVFCLALVPSTGEDDTAIGLTAQQYYNVAYDLDAMKISFRRIHCELLDD